MLILIRNQTKLVNMQEKLQKAQQMFEPDKKDIEILRELCKDSRKSFREIARKLGIATSTVINRVNLMKKENVIRSSTLALDHEKLGYTLTALIEITVSKGKLVEVEKEISQIHNVYGVYDITGTSDAAILARCKTRKELNDLAKSLLVMEYVERTNTHLVLNVVKEEYNVI